MRGAPLPVAADGADGRREVVRGGLQPLRHRGAELPRRRRLHQRRAVRQRTDRLQPSEGDAGALVVAARPGAPATGAASGVDADRRVCERAAEPRRRQRRRSRVRAARGASSYWRLGCAHRRRRLRMRRGGRAPRLLRAETPNAWNACRTRVPPGLGAQPSTRRPQPHAERRRRSPAQHPRGARRRRLGYAARAAPSARPRRAAPDAPAQSR